jgi:hypothetical protein
MRAKVSLSNVVVTCVVAVALLLFYHVATVGDNANNTGTTSQQTKAMHEFTHVKLKSMEESLEGMTDLLANIERRTATQEKQLRLAGSSANNNGGGGNAAPTSDGDDASRGVEFIRFPLKENLAAATNRAPPYKFYGTQKKEDRSRQLHVFQCLSLFFACFVVEALSALANTTTLCFALTLVPPPLCATVVFEQFFKHADKGPVTKGTFVEIGGKDGTYGNSLFFERFLGWRGTMIEGSPGSYRKLERNRPLATTIGIAVCAKDGTTEYLTKGGGGTAVDGMVDTMSEKFKR